MKGRWCLLVLPLAALAAALPLMMHGVSCGHDFDFHLDSWIEVAQQWRQGIGWPHWDVSANFGAGEPRFVFYPPLSWMLGALLGMVFGWNAAPVLFVFLAVLGAGVGMYLLARDYAERRGAVIAVALYATNPYMMFVVYERSAYAELLAAAWMPLVLLYTLRARVEVHALALAVALCWLTNGPAGVIATYVVALVLLLRLVFERDWRNMLRGGAAVALGIGLAAFYLWPAAVERRWIQIENAVADDASPSASFLFGHVGPAEHVVVLHAASVLAVVLFVTATVAYAVAGRQKGGAGRLALPAILLGVLLLLMLPVSALAWHYAPELRFLQFPWRFLVVVGALAALGAAVASRDAGKYAWALLVLAVVSVTWAYPRFQQFCDEEDAVAGQTAAINNGAGVEGSDEYSSKDSDTSHLATGMPHAWLTESADGAAPRSEDEARISVREWSAEDRRLVVRSDRGGFLVVRLMDFPAWRLRVDGREVQEQQQRNDGLVAVPIAAGVSRLEFLYREPRDEFVGRMISFGALFVLLGMSLWSWRAQRRLS